MAPSVNFAYRGDIRIAQFLSAQMHAKGLEIYPAEELDNPRCVNTYRRPSVTQLPHLTPYDAPPNEHTPKTLHEFLPRLNTPTPPAFRVETKKVFICTYDTCNKTYSRLPDLHRHHRGAHLRNQEFKCRALGCERAVRGFPRRDKRDTHEQKMHVDIGNGVLL